jgi:hypothetical protein
MLPKGLHVVILATLAVVFTASHVPFINRTPATVDAANLALGVGDYDLADDRPHPPGYPVVIALGKLARPVLDAFSPAAPPRDAVRALAMWSILFGALAPLALFHLFRSLSIDTRLAAAATALTVTCPLFWFNGGRPLSDIPGLVAAVSAQALLLRGWRTNQNRLVLAGSLAAGLSVGFRVQNVWLTLPLLLWIVFESRRGGRVIAAVGMWSLGLVLWALPMLIAVGGPFRYLEMFMLQGARDFAEADILIARPTADRLVVGLLHTFAYPWATAWSAAATLGFALLGAVAVRNIGRSTQVAFAVSYLPYAMFHLVFQESVHVRYALPLIPAVAYLAVAGVQALTSRWTPGVVFAMSMASVAIAAPPVAAYAAATPAYQALDHLRQRAVDAAGERVIAMHHGISRLLRGEQLPLEVIPVAAHREWLALVNHWRARPDVPVWFLAERGRGDLALIDPRSRRLLQAYGWSFPRKFLMSRMPSEAVEWYEFAPPGWIAAEGWALSHEAASVAGLDNRGPAVAPILALVRQRAEDAVLVIGGRSVSARSGPDARVELTLGGRVVDAWTVRGHAPAFLRVVPLPAGILASADAYVLLTVSAQPIGTERSPLIVSVDQFDVQSANVPVYGLDVGWYAPEYERDAPSPWRWTARAADVRVHHGGHDLELRAVVEVPLDHVARAPRVVVRAGSRVLTEVIAQGRNLELTARVPADALDRAGGILVLETDQTFVPNDQLGNDDPRRLGLRVYEFVLHEVP